MVVADDELYTVQSSRLKMNIMVLNRLLSVRKLL